MDKDKQKFVLIGIAAAGIIFAYFYFLFFPTIKKIKLLNADLLAKTQLLEEAKTKAKELEILAASVEKIEGDFIFLMKRMPVSDEIPVLLKSVNQAAIESELTFLSFEPQKYAKKDFYSEIPIKINLVSKYHNIGTFLNKLNFYPRLVGATDIQMAGLSTDLRGSVSIIMYLMTYVIPEDKKPEEKITLATTSAVTLKTKSVSASATVQKSQQQEKKQIKDVVNERPIVPEFLYRNLGKRDIFDSKSATQMTSLLQPVNILTLRLTGIISSKTKKLATLEDTNGIKYILTNNKLYTSNKTLIEDVYGSIQKDKVFLSQKDINNANTTKKVSLQLSSK